MVANHHRTVRTGGHGDGQAFFLPYRVIGAADRAGIGVGIDAVMSGLVNR